MKSRVSPRRPHDPHVPISFPFATNRILHHISPRSQSRQSSNPKLPRLSAISPAKNSSPVKVFPALQNVRTLAYITPPPVFDNDSPKNSLINQSLSSNKGIETPTPAKYGTPLSTRKGTSYDNLRKKFPIDPKFKKNELSFRKIVPMKPQKQDTGTFASQALISAKRVFKHKKAPSVCDIINIDSERLMQSDPSSPKLQDPHIEILMNETAKFRNENDERQGFLTYRSNKSECNSPGKLRPVAVFAKRKLY